MLLNVTAKGVPMRSNIVRKTTESKYVVVSPRLSGDGDVEAARASNTMEEKYATETPDDIYHQKQLSWWTGGGLKVRTSKFILPNRTKRFHTGVRLPLFHRACISLKLRLWKFPAL